MKDVENFLRLVEVSLTERTWTKGTLARNNDDHKTGVHAEDACRWCILGHIQRLSYNNLYLRSAAIRCIEYAMADLHCQCEDSVAQFNDLHDTKFSDVSRVVSRAISAAASPPRRLAEHCGHLRLAYAVRK